MMPTACVTPVLPWRSERSVARQERANLPRTGVLGWQGWGMSPEGRIGVVTGAGRGIGREIALALAGEGMSLLLLARTGDQVRAVAQEIMKRHGVRCLPAAVDVTDSTAVARAVRHAERHLGTVDVLVNNAGVIERDEVPFWEADLDDLWRVVEINLRGPLVVTRALLPAMVQRGRGHVVNITSHARAATGPARTPDTRSPSVPYPSSPNASPARSPARSPVRASWCSTCCRDWFARR
jgi:NAD(P)-dependent dehydrogenase (short-subunit alcohol dehydrogenase family)